MIAQNKVCIIISHLDDNKKEFILQLSNQGYYIAVYCKTSTVHIENIIINNNFNINKILSEKASIYHIFNADTLYIGFILKLFDNKVIYEIDKDIESNNSFMTFTLKLNEKIAGIIFDAVIVKEFIRRTGQKFIVVQNEARLETFLSLYRLLQTNMRIVINQK